MSPERLQKTLASAGIASRRDCEELIKAGRISVNGKVVHVLGMRVDPEHDQIAVDGRPIGQIRPRMYVLLYKPTGVVSTADDPEGRPTVVDLVDLPGRLFPVGRLDYDSEGLLLLTDDGELTQRLTHPSYQIEKEYRVLLDQAPSPDSLREWRGGVMLNGSPTAPAWVDVLERAEEGVWIRVVLHEGRKRQIREVAALLGYTVLRLIRVREGPISLGDLAPGAWRELSDEEVEQLWAHVGGRADTRAFEATTQSNAYERGTDHYELERQRSRKQPSPQLDSSPTQRPAPRRVSDSDRGTNRQKSARFTGQQRPNKRGHRDMDEHPRTFDRERQDTREQHRERAPEKRGSFAGPRRQERSDRAYDQRQKRSDRPSHQRNERSFNDRTDRFRNGNQRGEWQHSDRRERREVSPRRDEQAYQRDNRRSDLPYRDDRSVGTRGSRRVEQPYRDRRPAQYNNERRFEKSPRFNPADTHEDRPEPGNERQPYYAQREEKRGPGRQWRAQQERNENDRMKRSSPGTSRSSRFGQGSLVRRNRFPFRSRQPNRGAEDEE